MPIIQNKYERFLIIAVQIMIYEYDYSSLPHSIIYHIDFKFRPSAEGELKFRLYLKKLNNLTEANQRFCYI